MVPLAPPSAQVPIATLVVTTVDENLRTGSDRHEYADFPSGHALAVLVSVRTYPWMLRPSREMPGRARLTPTDAAWYRLDHRRNPVDVTAVLTFDEPLPSSRLLARLEQRLLAHPRFRRRVVAPGAALGPPRWEEEPGFSVGAHLRHARVRPPGGRQELEVLVSELMNEPLDWSRSPWRAMLVEGLPEGRSALVVQVHHCIGDGFALLEILLSLADDDHRGPTEAPVPSAWPLPRSEIRARDVPRLVLGTSLALARLLRLSSDPETSLRGAHAGTRRASWSRGIPLEHLRARAHASGGKINDVLLGAVTGAIRRYLHERGELARPLRAVMPVNLRPPGVAIDLERGNWFGLVWVDLPVDQPDRAARDRALRASIARAKRSMEAFASLGVLAIMGRVPLLVERAIEALFVRKGSLVVTNVPGPRARLHFVGVPLREIVFWVPHPRLSLGISLVSYAGEVRIGARADVSVVPHPERIIALLEDELDLDLATSSRERPVPAQPPS